MLRFNICTSYIIRRLTYTLYSTLYTIYTNKLEKIEYRRGEKEEWGEEKGTNVPIPNTGVQELYVNILYILHRSSITTS